MEQGRKKETRKYNRERERERDTHTHTHTQTAYGEREKKTGAKRKMVRNRKLPLIVEGGKGTT
jgi:hypothetical protein